MAKDELLILFCGFVCFFAVHLFVSQLNLAFYLTPWLLFGSPLCEECKKQLRDVVSASVLPVETVRPETRKTLQESDTEYDFDSLLLFKRSRNSALHDMSSSHIGHKQSRNLTVKANQNQSTK